MFICMFIFTIHLSCTRVPDMHATWPHLLYSLVHATWPHLLYSFGASDNPRPVCPDFRAWSVADPSVAIRVAQQKLGRHHSDCL